MHHGVSGSWRTEFWVVALLFVIFALLVSSRHALLPPAEVGFRRENEAANQRLGPPAVDVGGPDDPDWFKNFPPDDVYDTDYDAEYPGNLDSLEWESTSRFDDSRSDDAEQQQQQQTTVARLPQAIIIGVKKGGTRALLEFLRVHPNVRAPGPEVHFFDRHYYKGFDWYRSLMPPTTESQVTIEKTPSYFVTKSAPSRIYNMSRSARLIIVVRDPVTRAISDYTQVASKRRDLRSFAEMAFLDNATGPVATSWGAIKIGLYAKHLERWLHFFPRRQLHFISGERLIDDPATEMAHLQDFLGLGRFVTEKHFYFNATKGFPCLRKSERTVTPHCLGKTKGRLHPTVDEKVLQRLRNFYRPFNEKFYQITGINFGWP